MSKLSLIDAGFLAVERRNTPMHIGGLNLFELPKGVKRDAFMQSLLGNLRSTTQLQRPFCDRLDAGMFGSLAGAAWVTDTALDLDYHIRHSALPTPGRYRELFALVSRLHGTLLDRSRPLWEMHLIEGVKKREFALYTKYHHACIDGVRGIQLTQSMFSSDPNEVLADSPLSEASHARYLSLLEERGLKHRAKPEFNQTVVERLKAQFDVAGDVYGRTLKQLQAIRRLGVRDTLMPWSVTPRSALNTPVDGARRFVAQSFALARFTQLASYFECTINDMVLAVCAGALREYLQTHAQLPEKPLRALVPVSLRKAGDTESANAIGGILANLATNEKDPIKRLHRIRQSMLDGKAMYEGMSASEAGALFALMQSQVFLISALQLSDKLPAINTTISNVPGPREPLYWNGARMKGIYPASIVLDGFALNITLVSYDQHLDFGIVACRRSVPQVQRVIEYIDNALNELERVAGIAASSARNAPCTVSKTPKSPAKRSAKSR